MRSTLLDIELVFLAAGVNPDAETSNAGGSLKKRFDACERLTLTDRINDVRAALSAARDGETNADKHFREFAGNDPLIGRKLRKIQTIAQRMKPLVEQLEKASLEETRVKLALAASSGLQWHDAEKRILPSGAIWAGALPDT